MELRRSLALLVGAVVLAAGLGGVPPSGAAQPTTEHLAAAELEVDRRTIDLEAGWVVPEVAETDHGHLADHHDQAGLREATVGASIALDGEPQMLVIDTGGELGSFAVRSRNAGQWSDWIGVETPLEEAPDGMQGEEGSGRQVDAIGPIWLGDDVTDVELVATGAAPSSLTVEALTSTDDAPAVSAPAPVANALPGQPPIQPRSAWADRGWGFQNDGCEDGPRLSRNVRALVVHHTVTTNNYSTDQVDDLLRGIYRTHVDINGWCDVAYNFVIDRFGTIWETRAGGVDQPVMGGHAKGFNTHTVGVGVLGQHQGGASPASAPPSQAVLDSIRALASWKLGLHGVDPLGTTWLRSRTSATQGLRYANGTWIEVPTVLGHRDLGLTSCPGSRLYPSIPGIRQLAGTVRDTTIPFQFPMRAPLDSGPAVLSVDTRAGVRPAGAASSPNGAPGAQTASQAVAIDAHNGRGFVLLADGNLLGFGGASAPGSPPAGGSPVVDLVVAGDGGRGFVVDRNGRLHGFGGAPDRTPDGGPRPGNVVAAAVDDSGRGYVLDSSGGVHPVNGAGSAGAVANVAAVDIALRANGTSGWVLDVTGRLHPFGGAPAWQSPLAGASGGRARAVVTDPTDRGGWVLDSEGRLHSFGQPRQVHDNTTTVGAASIVDAGLWWHLPADLPSTEDGAYTRAVMLLFLGRAGSLEELDYHAWRIDHLGRSPVVQEFAQSDQWAGEILESIYRDVLGRPPDSSGRAYWVDQLANGLKTQELGALFYASPEYVEAAGSTAGYVRQLYQALLHRSPDAQGLAFWTGLLDSGRARPIDVSTGFYQSIESRRDRVTSLYDTILARAPEAEGLEFWAGRLLVEDDIALATNLAVSNEYFDRVTGG